MRAGHTRQPGRKHSSAGDQQPSSLPRVARSRVFPAPVERGRSWDVSPSGSLFRKLLPSHLCSRTPRSLGALFNPRHSASPRPCNSDTAGSHPVPAAPRSVPQQDGLFSPLRLLALSAACAACRPARAPPAQRGVAGRRTRAEPSWRRRLPSRRCRYAALGPPPAPRPARPSSARGRRPGPARPRGGAGSHLRDERGPAARPGLQLPLGAARRVAGRAEHGDGRAVHGAEEGERPAGRAEHAQVVVERRGAAAQRHALLPAVHRGTPRSRRSVARPGPARLQPRSRSRSPAPPAPRLSRCPP